MRGKPVTTKESYQLRIVGHIFVTSAFLSTTTCKKIAGIFAGSETRKSKDVIQVIPSITLDAEQATQKPVAFVEEYSAFNVEGELILPIGYVLRTASYYQLEV